MKKRVYLDQLIRRECLLFRRITLKIHKVHLKTGNYGDIAYLLLTTLSVDETFLQDGVANTESLPLPVSLTDMQSISTF